MKYTFLVIFIITFCVIPSFSQDKHLETGDTIPSFSLMDQDGKIFSPREFTGKKMLVIYFYPKDESTVCTKEACSFRDSYTDFTNAGALVIGINHASVATHKKFQLHHQLPFILLSDPDNKVLKMFGVKNKFLFTGRETFVIDKSGKIVFRYDSFSKGKEHQEEALTFIKKISQKE